MRVPASSGEGRRRAGSCCGTDMTVPISTTDHGQTNPSLPVENSPRLGSTLRSSAALKPIQPPSVAAYWVTDVLGSSRPEPRSSFVPSAVTGMLP